MLQRDAFIQEVVRQLAEDKNIYFLSADFGAAALDELRERYADNFLHCGISEQAMVDVAAGLALEGKKAFCYAMAPFLSLRAIEQIKCGPGMMNLPVVLVSVGVGLGYADSGPTHYVTEEFACLRSVVGSSIYTAADSMTASKIAKDLLKSPRFAYVRLDRHELPNIDGAQDHSDYRIIGSPGKQKIALLAHGRMVHTCIEAFKADPGRFFVVDLICAKPFPASVVELASNSRGILAVDEQTPSGALGAALFESCSAQDIFPRIINITLPEMYVFENGGRDYLLKKLGLSVENILKQATRLDA